MEYQEVTLDRLARAECIEREQLVQLLEDNMLVVMGMQKGQILAIGKGATTKVNVNLGTSPMRADHDEEMQKALVAHKLGADTVSDCSTMGDIDALRRDLVHHSGLPVTSIPVYQAVVERGPFAEITDDAILHVVQKHVDDGVSSIVIHAGFTKADLEYLREHKRVMGIVSKGGSMTAAISLSQDRENPFITLYDEILEIIEGTGVVLNLGNAMRSGCVHDLQDKAQFKEIKHNAVLAKRANQRGIPVIIEGLGGHVNAGHLKAWIEQHNRITSNRPLFVAGPLPTEIGLGHDHISAAIGGAMAAGYGADYLCAITPAEHLTLPSTDHVREGVIAAKIAAHVADSMKSGLNDHFLPDKKIAEARAMKRWTGQFDHAIDPDGASRLHPDVDGECAMCGKYCAIAIMKKHGL